MFLGKDAHLGSELTKSLSSVRLLGVVRFRSLPFLVVMDFLPHVKPISLLNLRALMRRKSCAVRMRNVKKLTNSSKGKWQEKIRGKRNPRKINSYRRRVAFCYQSGLIITQLQDV